MTDMPKTSSGTASRFEFLLQDVRYAVRGLRLRPGFAAMVILTLSLGIGANVTMFSILDRLLLRAPDHIVDVDQVVQVNTRWLGNENVQSSHPYRLYKDLLAVPEFEQVAVTTPSSVVDREYYPLGRGASATRVPGAQVTPNFFPLLGVRPHRGRFFQEDEAGEANPQQLAVIGYNFWQRQFGGRDNAIGSTLDLGTDRYTIVGVAPKGFTGVELSDVDVWIPIAAANGLRFAKGADWATTRNSQWLSVIARLKPGVNAERAAAQATAVFRAGERERVAAATNPSPRFRASPDSQRVELSSILPGKSDKAFGLSARSAEMRVSQLLGGVSIIVLLIACANVANLLLVRAIGRRREIAVRLALGITRARLVRQLLVEGLLLSILGGAGALLCAQWSSGFIRRMLLGETAWSDSAIDLRLMLFTVVAAIGTGLLTSLLPALQASRPELTSALKAGAREGGGARSRTRSILLAGQAALAIILLAGAGLFVRSLQNVANTPLGIDIDKVLVAGVAHASVGMSNAEAREVFRRVTERATEIPGISAAATSVGLSFGMGWGTSLFVPGREAPAQTNNPSQYAVTPDYFKVLGIRLVDGRLFTPSDRIGSELVAVINETAARTFWPGLNPVGQCVRIGADTMPCTTVIGIVTDARRQRLVETPTTMIYRPLDQLDPSVYDRSVSFFGFSFIARTTRKPSTLAEPLRRLIQSAGPNMPYAEVRPLADRLGRQTRSWTLGATMFTIFGALSLLVAAIGLYSVVAFAVAQRLHEFGVRVALGATGANLVRLTLLRGVMPVVVGMGVGLAVALGLSRLMEGMLFEMSPRDPTVYATAGAALLVVAILASLVPARRAAKADPMLALRSD
jgi:predicted permease